MKSGAFDLTTSFDLLGKLRHDVARLEANHADSYAAFDVAVTGYHIAEWVAAEKGDDFSSRVNGEPCLRVARALANGGKHFTASGTRNSDVTDSGKSGVWGSSWAPGTWGNGVWESWLEIEVVPLIGNAMGGKRLKAHEWARELLAYWEREFAKSATIPT